MADKGLFPALANSEKTLLTCLALPAILPARAVKAQTIPLANKWDIVRKLSVETCPAQLAIISSLSKST